MDNKEKIYRYNDFLSFRVCKLCNKINSPISEDCTCYEIQNRDWTHYYSCLQNGIHFHCTKHPEIEFDMDKYGTLKCPICGEEKNIDVDKTIKDCIKLLNSKKFKNANFIRLDDWYIPEIKIKEKRIPNYWIHCDVKKDKDGDTIIVLYIGCKDSEQKTQFFIKPEKLQLSNDYKDLDPATILSKIEVTLKDRILEQEYDSGK